MSPALAGRLSTTAPPGKPMPILIKPQTSFHSPTLISDHVNLKSTWSSLCYILTYISACLFVWFFKILFIYLLLAVLGLRFCTRASSSCGKRGPLFIAVRGPLTIAGSLVVEHRLQTHRLSNYGSRAQPLRGTWDPPRPGLEPVSPALAGRLSTTAPPGKPRLFVFKPIK